MQLGIKKQQKYNDKVVILSHNVNVCHEKYTYDFPSVWQTLVTFSDKLDKQD